MFYSKGHRAQQHVLSRVFSAHKQRPNEQSPSICGHCVSPSFISGISQKRTVWSSDRRFGFESQRNEKPAPLKTGGCGTLQPARINRGNPPRIKPGGNKKSAENRGNRARRFAFSGAHAWRERRLVLVLDFFAEVEEVPQVADGGAVGRDIGVAFCGCGVG